MGDITQGQAEEVIRRVAVEVDPLATESFGKYMRVQQYGTTPHYLLFSDAPGNDLGEGLIIYEEDLAAIALLFSNLAERSIQSQLSEFEKGGKIVEVAEKPKKGKKKNEHLADNIQT